MQQAHEHFGRLDIVINNAGYGHFGAVEELSEDDIRAQLETNLFGALWITQAALPILRAQGSGHIIQVSSIGGVGAFPNVGAYHASKWGLEAFSESMAQEVAPFGIKVDAGRAGRLLDRLGRGLLQQLDPDGRLRPRPGSREATPRRQPPPAARSLPPAPCSRSSTPRSRLCVSCSAGRRRN